MVKALGFAVQGWGTTKNAPGCNGALSELMALP